MASQIYLNSIHHLSQNPHPQRVIIVDAGIVRSALANLLSQHSHFQVILLDRSLETLTGSTGHAPSFVGQLNQNSWLTQLAVTSVKSYAEIPGAYDRVGGLEIASSDEEAAKLGKRLELAKKAGLEGRNHHLSRRRISSPSVRSCREHEGGSPFP